MFLRNCFSSKFTERKKKGLGVYYMTFNITYCWIFIHRIKFLYKVDINVKTIQLRKIFEICLCLESNCVTVRVGNVLKLHCLISINALHVMTQIIAIFLEATIYLLKYDLKTTFQR